MIALAAQMACPQAQAAPTGEAAHPGIEAVRAAIDTAFATAGNVLATTLDLTAGLASELESVAGALDGEATLAAIADMRRVSAELRALPAERRAGQDAQAHLASMANKLRHLLDDMLGLLKAFRIYGMNIKIVAAGNPSFAHFADDMIARIGKGEATLEGVLATLRDLDGHIAGLADSEARLCQALHRVVPQVPDRLDANAASLGGYLNSSRALMAQGAATARRVQSGVTATLGALQVGDSTVQRLDHAGAIARRAAGVVDLGPEAAALLSCLAARQVEGARADFARATPALVASLKRLLPEAARLRDMVREQQEGRGRHFLSALEADIGELDGITRELAAARALSDTSAALIAGLAEDLRASFKALESVRQNVQNLAINTRLLCSRHQELGKPVGVIAMEINASAARLGQSIAAAGVDVANLHAASEMLADQRAGDGGAEAGGTLDDALEVIRLACRRASDVAERHDSRSGEMIATLATTARQLEAEIGQEGTMAALAQALFPGGFAPPAPPAPGSPLAEAMTAIHACYTMASERIIHRQLAGEETGSPTPVPPAAAACVLPDNDDDDDVLL